MSALPIKAFRSSKKPFDPMCGAQVPKSINCLLFFSNFTFNVYVNDKLTLGSSISRLKTLPWNQAFPASHVEGIVDLLLYNFQEKESQCKQLQYVQNDSNYMLYKHHTVSNLRRGGLVKLNGEKLCHQFVKYQIFDTGSDSQQDHISKTCWPFA